MKWFKHDTDAKSSEKCARLIGLYGFAGYGRYWRIMEIVAEKMDQTSRCHVEFSSRQWAELLGMKIKQTEEFLSRLPEIFPSVQVEIKKVPSIKFTVEGTVYILKADSLYKIGSTCNLPARIRQLQSATGTKLELFHTIETQDINFTERHLHKLFQKEKIRGEWFELSDTDLVSIKNLNGIQMDAERMPVESQMVLIRIPNLLKKRDNHTTNLQATDKRQTSASISISSINNIRAIPRAKSSKEKILSFPEFWSWYPVHVARKQCENKFSSLTEIQLHQIKDVMSLPEFIKITFGEFIVNPLTFLNGERWKDEPRKHQKKFDPAFGNYSSEEERQAKRKKELEELELFRKQKQ